MNSAFLSALPSDLPPTTKVDASGPAASRLTPDPEDVVISTKRYMSDLELVQAFSTIIT